MIFKGHPKNIKMIKKPLDFFKEESIKIDISETESILFSSQRIGEYTKNQLDQKTRKIKDLRVF